jgi:hypothetical protein
VTTHLSQRRRAQRAAFGIAASGLVSALGGCAPASGGAYEGTSSAAASSDDAGDTVTLFDGTLGPDWRMSTIRNQPGRDDPGRFAVEGGALVAHPGTDLGLLWNTRPAPADFELSLEWRLSAPDDNSGVFVRFPDLDAKGYDNTAWVAIDFGFEIQINEPGFPDGAPDHTTGAIYAQPNQDFTRVVARPPGEWNAFTIRVVGQVYTVWLNGQRVTRYVNDHPGRGLPSTESAPAFVGLQTHTGNVAFRNIRIRPAH